MQSTKSMPTHYLLEEPWYVEVENHGYLVRPCVRKQCGLCELLVQFEIGMGITWWFYRTWMVHCSRRFQQTSPKFPQIKVHCEEDRTLFLLPLQLEQFLRLHLMHHHYPQFLYTVIRIEITIWFDKTLHMWFFVKIMFDVYCSNYRRRGILSACAYCKIRKKVCA